MAGDPQRPVTNNLWLYAESNPINNVDPTGNMSCKDSEDPQCVARAQLLRIYANYYKNLVTKGDLLPVDTFSRFINKSMSFFGNDIEGMMWGSTNVLLGIDPNETFSIGLGVPFGIGVTNSPYAVGQHWLPYKNNPTLNVNGEVHSERGDWRVEYFDGTANQAFHFWYSVATTFYDGDGLAWIANIMHDPYFLECMLGEDLEKIGDKPIIKIFHSLASPGTSKEDYQLAIQGIDLGTELWWANKLSAPGKTPIISLPGSDPAAWISTHLGE